MAETTNENKSNTTPAPVLTDYLFPEHGVTIAAASLEEAEAKLAEQLKK